MPPDGHRSEVPYAWGEPFWVLFWRLKKVPRRKGETLSGRYRSNGYVHLQKMGRLSGRHREQAHSYKRRKQLKGQCAVTRCRKPEPLGDNANANCVRLCICVNRNTCDTYNFTVFSVIPNSHAI